MSTDLNRLLTLSGKNSNQDLINKLSIDRKNLDENYERTLENLKKNNQIDEGIFTALKTAFNTASNMGKAGVQGVKNQVNKIASNVREVYKTARVQAELKNLIDGLKQTISEFDDVTKSAPTIIRMDQEINKELELFRDVFINMVKSLVARQAVSEGLDKDDDAIKNMMVEMGIITEEPVILSEESKMTYKLLQDIMGTPEFEEVTKRMKFISTATQLKNGTLSFNTGMHGINNDGSEDKSSSYLLKIYPTGQIRAELKGPNIFKSYFGSHYRVGKPITGKDQADMYRKALVDLVKRFEKKKARYGKEKQIIADRFAEFKKIYVDANYGSDAEQETDNG